MEPSILAEIEDSVRVKQLLKSQSENIARTAKIMIDAINNNGKVMFCGNGGSAADSQHIAAELVGKFLKKRGALPAIALTTNTSILTAIANDFSYDDVFARQVEALATAQDVLVGISTSGNSRNVITAMSVAKTKGCKTVGFTGYSGGKLGKNVEVCIKVPSENTQRIQECHIMIGHILCSLVESNVRV